MRPNLTEKQSNFLRKIISLSKDKGYPPTYRELAEETGLSIKMTANYVEILEKKGFIKKEPFKSRAIKVI